MKSQSQAVHPLTAKKREALREQLQPAIDELLIAEAWVVASGVDVNDATQTSDVMTDEQKAHVVRFLDAKQAFYALIEEQLTVVAQYLAAIEALPRTVDDACVQAATFQLDYENAAANSLTAIDEHRQLDILTGRIRGDVVDRLLRDAKQRGEALSPTAADKLASSDEEYTQHKDSVAAAASAKDRAEKEESVTLEKLRTARDILRGLVQVSEARAGRPSVVLDRVANESGPDITPQGRGGKFDNNGVRLLHENDPRDGQPWTLDRLESAQRDGTLDAERAAAIRRQQALES